jgi:hypothetical protein
VLPKKHFDFMEMENIIRNPISKAAMIAKRLEEFNPNSMDIKNYNEELRLQLNLF